MLNLFFLLLLTAGVLSSNVMSGESSPRICEQYRQDHNQSGHNTKARRDIPYGDGLLWEIRNAGGRVSYLFGTMHSQDRKVTSIPPPARLALQKSRLLLMEVVPDETVQQQFIDSIYFTDGSNLQSLLDREIYDELVFRIADYRVTEENVWRLKPWAAFTLIGRPRPVNAATQEQVLMRLALNSNKTIAGLESMQELAEALDGIPLDDQIIILNDTVCNHTDIIRKTRDLVDMYVARDLAGIVLFNEQPHYDEAVFERFMQRILYDRNKRMLERIAPYLEKGSAFIAIGASHLPDDKGLLKLLENRNYTISRIY
jgi:uncharacterized protein YbaP (TraB family)